MSDRPLVRCIVKYEMGGYAPDWDSLVMMMMIVKYDPLSRYPFGH